MLDNFDGDMALGNSREDIVIVNSFYLKDVELFVHHGTHSSFFPFRFRSVGQELFY
jgi:hypothetical protein